MQEVRCTKCNKLLHKLTDIPDDWVKDEVMSAGVETKCLRCGTINQIKLPLYNKVEHQ